MTSESHFAVNPPSSENAGRNCSRKYVWHKTTRTGIKSIMQQLWKLDGNLEFIYGHGYT